MFKKKGTIIQFVLIFIDHFYVYCNKVCEIGEVSKMKFCFNEKIPWSR